jgi:hypothetical protein
VASGKSRPDVPILARHFMGHAAARPGKRADSVLFLQQSQTKCQGGDQDYL